MPGCVQVWFGDLSLTLVTRTSARQSSQSFFKCSLPLEVLGALASFRAGGWQFIFERLHLTGDPKVSQHKEPRAPCPKTSILGSVCLAVSSAVSRVCYCLWLSRVQFFITPRTAARQASLSSTISWSLLRFMSIESTLLSNHLVLCCAPLLLPSIFPSIRVVSNESALRTRWPRCWSLSINPSSEYSGLISFRTDWPPINLLRWPLAFSHL